MDRREGLCVVTEEGISITITTMHGIRARVALGSSTYFRWFIVGGYHLHPTSGFTANERSLIRNCRETTKRAEVGIRYRMGRQNIKVWA